ncbi:MAG: hypothetical protein JRE82_15645 [Deltaproteobacteria bacterium]|nr:hypothetical protein [Deltaproteobacteria bacterium]
MRRVRGFIDLVFDVVEETTNLAQRTHNAVVERSVRRFAPVEPATSTAKAITGVETAISGGVFESIRVVNGSSPLSRHSARARLGPRAGTSTTCRHPSTGFGAII